MEHISAVKFHMEYNKKYEYLFDTKISKSLKKKKSEKSKPGSYNE